MSDAELATRRANALRLLGTLGGRALRPIEPPTDSEPGYLRLAAVACERLTGSFDKSAARHLGIEFGYPLSLDRLPGFGDRRLNAKDDFPGATILSQRLLTLPVHGAMSSFDFDAVVAWCRERERSVSS